MNIKHLTRRVLSVLMAALAVIMLLPCVSAFAANTQLITDIKLAAGADAVDKLEADGYSVMLTGLNMTYDTSKQVYLGYKLNDGIPITNIIISAGEGSVKDNNGISYDRASDVDVDEGIGGGTGYLYFTRDTKAGSPLVGLDVLRSKEEALYPVTNDGAEIVRTAKGTPADLESASENAVVYLAQIRDGIVRPYISEIGVVTDTDKWNAVYTACERGYNYYVEGDIDKSDDTYTILVYKRTANVNDAITNITAVSEKAVEAMEKASDELTGAAIDVSGVEYVRVSSKPIEANQPYYLYQTKNTAAGNPVSMLYAEEMESEQNSLFGTWANGYFASKGTTSAYMFCANEDLFASLNNDLTVMTKLPVNLLEKVPSVETAEETAPEKETTTDATTDATTEAGEEGRFVKIAMLTPRDGLPESAAQIMGLSDSNVEAPFIEHTERSDRENKLGASVFGKHAWVALLLGSVAIVGTGVATVVFRKKKSEKTR